MLSMQPLSPGGPSWLLGCALSLPGCVHGHAAHGIGFGATPRGGPGSVSHMLLSSRVGEKEGLWWSREHRSPWRQAPIFA